MSPNVIENLASQILYYKHRYYSGLPTVPDSVYDALEDELKKLSPHHPVLNIVGDDFFKAEKKVPHVPPMLSLNKTYSFEDLFEFIQKNECIVSEKFDGMALALEYNSKGFLSRASTRGSGKIGEDVTGHVLQVDAIPKHLNLDFLQEKKILIEVRGEVFFPISKFDKFAERFDSYRNAVPGTFGRKEINEAKDVLSVLSFCAYDFFFKTSDSQILSFSELNGLSLFWNAKYIERMEWLESFGFYTGVKNHLTHIINATDEHDLAQQFHKKFESKRDYQIDGMVIRYNDDEVWDKLGVTSHHPRGSIAYKQASEIAVTKILAIEESIGRSGKITFRAKLEPVNLSGAKITYATLHNAEFIEKGNYAPGALVKLTRSGEVIPSIVGLEQESDQVYHVPKACPCGYAAIRIGPDLFCGEKRTCARKDQESLVYFVHTLEIMGVSDKIILKLREAGLVERPADLYRLTVEDLLSLEGFQQKSAENVINAIQQKKVIPLSQFLTSLGLKRGGAVKSQDVAKKYKTLAQVRSAKVEDLQQEKGWAQKSAEDFIISLNEKSEVIDDLLKFVCVEDDTTQNNIDTTHPFFGKVFCITGALSKPRDEYKQQLEAIGAKVTDAVSSKTDFLVCNEESKSSKFKKAKELGIPILKENEMADKLS